MTIVWTKSRWLFASSAVLSLGSLEACGGSDDSAPAAQASPSAAAMTTLGTDMTRSLTRLGALESGTLLVMNAGSPLAPNVTSTFDTSPAAPPNTYSFGGTFDGNGNGHDETTIDVRTTFVNDPGDFFGGFDGAQGTAAVDISILGLMHIYHGNVAFELGMNEHHMSGSGTFSNPLTGVATTMNVSAADPLGIRLADGSANAKPNACAHSLDGPVQLSVAGPGGTLASQWRFAYGSTMVAVTGATFTTPAGETTVLPDASLDLGCAGNNNIDDWNGRFRIRWACLPAENGEFATTIAVKNASTVTMIDDGDTAADAYDASLIGASPRAIRGFFIDGDAGSRYREDFNWTLNLDGSGFSQTSRYVYFEGPQAGRGGICVARATRI